MDVAILFNTVYYYLKLSVNLKNRPKDVYSQKPVRNSEILEEISIKLVATLKTSVSQHFNFRYILDVHDIIKKLFLAKYFSISEVIAQCTYSYENLYRYFINLLQFNSSISYLTVL